MDTVYHLSYPSGAFTNIGGDVSYVGTAYTFDSIKIDYQLWAWGFNGAGALGQNTQGTTSNASPLQIPGLAWANIAQNGSRQGYNALAVKTDGTLWGWGSNQQGELGLNSVKGWPSGYSSPVQVGSSTNWSKDANTNHLIVSGNYNSAAIKTDGTLWTWGGAQTEGNLGLNDTVKRSSPTQIPGTTWKGIHLGGGVGFATKTDGTLWGWGSNYKGALGVPSIGDAKRSSPVQIPGTTWDICASSAYGGAATKTDGTLWSWGYNENGGQLGQNNRTNYSSPVQIPGTTWAIVKGGGSCFLATKTDGTLWGWGSNAARQLGQGDGASHPATSKVQYSSPVQIPGTTWSTNLKDFTLNFETAGVIKTDGTLWMWGMNYYGSTTHPSTGAWGPGSPYQIPGTTWYKVGGGAAFTTALKKIES